MLHDTTLRSCIGRRFIESYMVVFSRQEIINTHGMSLAIQKETDRVLDCKTLSRALTFPSARNTRHHGWIHFLNRLDTQIPTHAQSCCFQRGELGKSTRRRWWREMSTQGQRSCWENRIVCFDDINNRQSPKVSVCSLSVRQGNTGKMVGWEKILYGTFWKQNHIRQSASKSTLSHQIVLVYLLSCFYYFMYIRKGLYILFLYTFLYNQEYYREHENALKLMFHASVAKMVHVLSAIFRFSIRTQWGACPSIVMYV